jgi:hypothetical protein
MQTKAQQIVEILADLVPDEGRALARRYNEDVLEKAESLQAAVVPCLGQDPMYASIWQRFQRTPEDAEAFMVNAVGMLIQADAALARRLDALLAAYQQAMAREAASVDVAVSGAQSVGAGGDIQESTINIGDREHVETGGGAYIRGNVDSGGGKLHVGDEIHHGTDPRTVAQTFAQIYDAVDAREDLAPEVQDELEALKAEVAKGEDARESFIAQRLRNIGRMAPDILEVVVSTLTNPLSGLSTVAKKVAARAKGEGDDNV